MTIPERDKDILRELGEEVARIAALPEQRERMELHKKLNALAPERPMVMIDQVCWHEMNVDDELTNQCADDFCRRIEGHLRRVIYQWKHMPGDMVVTPYVDLPKVFSNTGFGIHAEEETAALDPENDVVGHLYHDQLEDENNIEKIREPEVRLDKEATERDRQAAEDIFGGVLKVRMQGPIPYFPPWDRLAQWRGAQAAVMDLAVRPDYVHALLRRITDVHLSWLDQLESEDILGPHQGTVHCTGAWTDELKSSDPDNAHALAADCWTFGMAQIFSTVSPAMHAEFEVPYFNEWAERFGLVYYGCCEPLDDRIDIVRQVKKVRKISMSPWVDVVRGAEAIGTDYVFSRKPSPAWLARDEWRPEEVEADLRQTAEACKQNGCPLEFILKDISTVHYEPRRLWEWSDIARRVVEDYS